VTIVKKNFQGIAADLLQVPDIDPLLAKLENSLVRGMTAYLRRG
jgi:hypothetical protein